MEDHEVAARVEALCDRWWNRDMLATVYGLRLPDELLIGRLRAWGQRRRTPRVVERGETIDRIALEGFFQWSQILPKRWAAARLGMTEGSLNDLLGCGEERGDFSLNRMDFSEQIISEGLVRRMYEFFPSLQGGVFSDHGDFCSRLHAAIAQDYGLEVEPLRDVTSLSLTPDEPDFAYGWDSVSDDPIGLRWQVWLDTKKPVNLPQDMCSKLLYMKHTDTLRPYLFGGREPDLPEGLAGA